MNKELPEEIKKWIEAEAEKRYPKHTFPSHAHGLLYMESIIFATSLYQHLSVNGRVGEQQKEIERLKGLIDSAFAEGFYACQDDGDGVVNSPHTWVKFKEKNNL